MAKRGRPKKIEEEKPYEAKITITIPEDEPDRISVDFDDKKAEEGHPLIKGKTIKQASLKVRQYYRVNWKPALIKKLDKKRKENA